MSFTVEYYVDIVNHDTTSPCHLHTKSYRTEEEGEDAASNELPKVRAQFGLTVRFAIVEYGADGSRTVNIGPGVHDK